MPSVLNAAYVVSELNKNKGNATIITDVVKNAEFGCPLELHRLLTELKLALRIAKRAAAKECSQ